MTEPCDVEADFSVPFSVVKAALEAMGERVSVIFTGQEDSTALLDRQDRADLAKAVVVENTTGLEAVCRGMYAAHMELNLEWDGANLRKLVGYLMQGHNPLRVNRDIFADAIAVCGPA